MMTIVALRAKLSNDLRTAMKERNPVTVSALRSLMAALDNAEAVPVDLATLPKVPTTDRYEVPRRELTREEIHHLLEREIAERKRVSDEYTTLGRTDEATRLQTEIKLIAAYL